MAGFETFDLGRVLQTAEGIKAARRQEGDDVLRRQYLQQQIASGQQNQDIQKQQFDEQKQATAARRQYYLANAVLTSANPKEAAETIAPDFVQQFDSHHGAGAWQKLTPEQAAQAAQAVLAQATSVIGPQTKVKWIDSGGQHIAVDEATGQPIKGVAPVAKSAAPESELARKRFAEDQRHNRATEANSAATTKAAKAPAGYAFKEDGSLAPIPGGPAQAGLANQFRDEYTKASGDFVKVGDAYTQIRNVAKSPSAAGDLSLIFSYMKMLDPGSTVREGEFANAQNAGGVSDRITAQYNKILRGERLSEPQRKDFVSQAKTVYESARSRHKNIDKRYRGLAEQSGLNPESVVTDYSVQEEQASQAPITATGPNGAKLILQNGAWVPAGG